MVKQEPASVEIKSPPRNLVLTPGSQSSSSPHQLQIQLPVLQLTPQQQQHQQPQFQRHSLMPSGGSGGRSSNSQQRADQIRATSNSVTVVVIKTMLPEQHK